MSKSPPLSSSPPRSMRSASLNPNMLIPVDEQTERARSGSTTSEGMPRRYRAFSIDSVHGRSIILAIDSSDYAHYAFDWFLENVYRPDDLLILVHIPETPRLPFFSFKNPMSPPVQDWKDIVDDMNTKVRKLHDEYEGICINRKIMYKIKGESMKNPGEGIVRIADNEKVTLICMGTRGLSGVKRSILGSVSDYVVRNASVPVIIVPSGKLSKLSRPSTPK